MPARIVADNSIIINGVLSDPRMMQYASRITPATQGNLKDTVRSIQSFQPAWNTFVDVLLDTWCLSLFRKRSWENKLAKFKTARVRNGSWVREVGVGLVAAHSYDKEATNVFGVEEPEIASYFHRQNRKDFYKVSVSPDILAQAMETEGELSEYVSTIIAAAQNSDNIDEYLIMRELLPMYNDAYGFFNVQVPDLASSSDKEADSKAITQKIQQVYMTFEFPNRVGAYSHAGLPYVSNEIVLISTPEFISNNNVYNLAAAFNMDKAEFMADSVQLVDEIPGIPGAQAILADKDWFVCTDTLFQTESIRNPANLAQNYFVHHWGVYSMSLLAPAVLFSTAADSTIELTTGTVTGVTLSLESGVEYARPGSSVKITADVAGTGVYSSGVSYELIGGSNVPLSTNTHIDGTGKLWVGSDERNAKITVVGTSVADPTKTGTVSVGIGAKATGDGVTSVTVGGAASVEPGSTAAMTATVAPASGVSQAVTWLVMGGTVDSYIEQDGTLHCAADEVADTLTVVAVSVGDPTKTGTKAVTVTRE